MSGDRLTMNSLNVKLDLLLKNQAEFKDSLAELNSLPARVTSLENFQEEQTTVNTSNDDRSKETDKRLNALERKFMEMKDQNEKEKLLKELYDKRLNLLHGKEDKAWESRKESKEHVLDFFQNALKLENASEITIVDVHRLPANKINARRGSVPGKRPIIFKLATIEDRGKIMKAMGNLKAYNASRPESQKVSLSRHLPRILQKQRKALIPEYIRRKKAGEKVTINVDFESVRMVITEKIIPSENDGNDNNE